jgi:hypothetical protein
VLLTFLLFFLGFFFEDRATGDSIGLCYFAEFVLLRVNQAGGKRSALVFAEFGPVAVFPFIGSSLSILHGLDFFFVEFGNVLSFGLGLFAFDFGGLGTGSGEEPAGKGGTRAAKGGSCAGNDCSAARLNVFRNVWLWLVNVFFDRRDGCGGHRAIAELRERFAGKKDFVFDRTGGTRRRAGLAVTADLRPIAAEISARAALVKAGAITTPRLVAAIVAFATLRRCVFRRREIPSARCSGTPAATAATSAAETSAAAIAATVSATISTAIEVAAATATATLRRPAAVTRRRLVLRRVVLWREILRRRFIRIGLAFIVKLLGVLGVAWRGVFAGRVNFFDVRADFVIFRVRVFVVVRNYGWRGFLSAAERFTGQKFDCRRSAFCGRSGAFVTVIAVAMIVVPVIVTFQIFEYVADVKECVAVQADVHESGLHARQNARDFSFVNAADEGELFFALDVDFY